MTHKHQKHVEHAGWRVGLAEQGNTPKVWTLISDEEYQQAKNRPGHVFQEVFAFTQTSEGSPHKVTADKSTAVDHSLEWLPINESTPLGVKVHALNLGLVATHTVLGANNLKDWKGWRPLPLIPASWRTPFKS